MLHKFMLTARPWQTTAVRFSIFVLTAVMTLIFLLCITAFMILKVDTPDYVLVPITTVLLTVSSFIDSFLLSKIFRENGIRIGLSFGIILILITVLLALYHGTFAFSALLFTKSAAVLTAGIIGGILGVNS